MNIIPQRSRWIAMLGTLVLAVIGIGGIPGATVAQSGTGLVRLSAATVSDYSALPLSVGVNTAPVVMLAMSADEQLHRVAYDDLRDVNGDGVIDATYSDAITYRGYFDSQRCYSYDGGRFRATAAVTPNTHRCAGNWSGNFLNWVSMSRLDIIRAGLYGGLRVRSSGDDDDDAGTVLERAYLPPESAAWVKVYRGPDAISNYTPFNVAAATPVSFCNVSQDNGDDKVEDSARDQAPPRLRVAVGNFPLWSSTEALQCLWDGEADRPSRSATGSAEFIVRVEVCRADAGALRESYCRGYPAANPSIYRPAGLLQEYGESGQLRFGLMSGSYAKPRSGGQLRRNPGRMAGNGNDPRNCAPGDEIRLSDGRFCNTSGSTEGIINTLNRLRPARYSIDYETQARSEHSDCDGVNRDVTNRGGANGVVNRANSCVGIGNPVAEMMAEVLRYLSGEASPTATFDASSGDRSFIPDIPTPAWRDPFAVDELCAECSVVMISSGSSSFDADELPAISQLSLNATSIAASTNRVGSNESLDGTSVLAGRVRPVTDSPDTINDSCEVSTLAHLADARGVCPAQPGREGSFNVAGLSLAAWTGDLRTNPGRQRAQTFALSFNDEVASIRIPLPTGEIMLTPACQFRNFPDRNCALVSMQPGPVPSNGDRGGSLRPYIYGRTISADGRAGSVMVSWHAAAYGYQRDDEVTEVLTWCVGSSCNSNLNDYTAGSGATDICWRADPATSPTCAANGGLVTAVPEDTVLIRTEIITGRNSLDETVGYSIQGAADGNGTTLLVTRPNAFPAGVFLSDNLINPPDATSREPAASSGSLSGTAAGWTRPQIRRYTAGGTVRRLENPLFYAAKYGSFDPADGSLPAATGTAPCASTSWDRVNNRTGASGADCVPDNFHDLQNPGDFEARLRRVLGSLSQRAFSGEQSLAGAAVASVGQGPGAVYQALYETMRSDGSNRVSWTGTLQALFIDRDGNLREEGTTADGQLDEADYAGHPVVQIYYDEDARQTRFRRYSANPAVDPTAFTVVNDVRQLRTLWNARRQLSALTNSSIGNQRAYGSAASNGRHIFTFADFNLDGRVDANEQIDFTADRFGSGRFGMLDVSSTTQAANLINFTRGQDGITGMRARRLNDDGVGDAEVIRLGDIVNSAPLAVGAPAEAYDLLYADQSYAAFFQRYRTRRNVVYVGANDGMLHAFNAGFFDAGNRRFRTQPLTGSATDHPLGSEIWAYVPFNLLPHLGWMADPAYGHVWTMDGSPRAFDVRAFTADATHPNGWGTILVVPMRLGGKSIRLPVASGALADYSTALGARTELETRPAYVILDVTDPEAEPRLIAEFSHPSLGFTTSNPAIAAFAATDAGTNVDGTVAAPAADRWYLMFGNGPDELSTAQTISTQNAKLFRLDLKALIGGSGAAVTALIDNGPIELAGNDARGFTGDPVAVDWDLNFRADALYVGTSGGNAGAPVGKLFRIDFRNPGNALGLEGSAPAGWLAPSVLLEAGRPILAAPSVTQDRAGNRWVLGGTGRYLADGDRASSSLQSLFGVIDRGGTAVDYNSLVDTAGATVTVEGTVSGVVGNLADGLPATTESRLIDLVNGARGWRFGLDRASNSAPAERSVSRTAVLDSLLFATSFTPSDTACNGIGNSRLFGFDFRTGAPRSSRPPFPLSVVTPGASLVGIINLGKGLGTAPTLHLDSAAPSGRGTVTINVQSSTGAIFQRDADVTGLIRSNEIDWRETHPN